MCGLQCDQFVLIECNQVRPHRLVTEICTPWMVACVAHFLYCCVLESNIALAVPVCARTPQYVEVPSCIYMYAMIPCVVLCVQTAAGACTV